MSTVFVHVSGHLKDYTGKKRDVQLTTPQDVVKLIYDLDEMFPGIRDRILDDHDRPREYVNIFVNGENVRDGYGEKTKLKDGDEVHVLPSIAGGWVE
jgi:molybdopterin synthase sulfur carrier subunit